MFQIRTDNEVSALLAVADALDEAFDAIEAIEDLTATQLARNGEGATRFALSLVIHHDGAPCAWHSGSVRPAG
jgi:hypothetical protein